MKKLHYAICTDENCVSDILNNEYSKYPNYKLVVLTNAELYVGYTLNEHHWKTAFVWNKFIPLLMNDLNIKFNPNHFKQVYNFTENELFDLKYHVPKKKQDLKLTFINTNFVLTGNHDMLRLDKNGIGFGTDVERQEITDYHRLYRGAHTNTILENLSIKSNRRLILNSDSFMIPVIPILSYYYKEILVLDNRKTDVLNAALIKSFIELDADYVACLWHKNILDNNKYSINLL